MSFLRKVDESKLKKAYEDIADVLENWARSVKNRQIVAASDPKFSLMRMNSAINYLRDEFKAIYVEYGKKENNLDLSVDSLSHFPALVKRIEKALVEARQLAYHFNDVILECDKNNYDIFSFLTATNRKSIERLFEMTTEDVLAIMNDAHLLGF